MEGLYGIAYYDMSLKKESDILQIEKNFIWKYETFEGINSRGYLDDEHEVLGNNLGCNIFGLAFKLNRNELLDIIKHNEKWFFEFNINLLTEEYYYLIWEDWS